MGFRIPPTTPRSNNVEPKPTFEWTSRHNPEVYHLTPTDINLPDYDIAIYCPYGDTRRPYVLVGDYWHDVQDKIAESHNIICCENTRIQGTIFEANP